MQLGCADLQGDLCLVFCPHEDLQVGKEQRSGQSTNLHYLWHIPQISQKSKLLLSSALIWTNRFLPVRPMTSRGLCLQCGNHGVQNPCSRYLVIGAGRMGYRLNWEPDSEKEAGEVS